MRHAEAMAARTASTVGCGVPEVLVASTGVIGVKLDMEKVTRGIASALRCARAPAAASDAARAIMTTDPFPKAASVEITSAARYVSRRRNRQRIGHDRAEHGDHARVCHH